MVATSEMARPDRSHCFKGVPVTRRNVNLSSVAAVGSGASRAVRTVSNPPLRGDFNSLGKAFEAAGHQLCEHEAYVDGADRMTFGEWLARSRGVAARLAAAGVRPGDVVAFML